MAIGTLGKTRAEERETKKRIEATRQIAYWHAVRLGATMDTAEDIAQDALLLLQDYLNIGETNPAFVQMVVKRLILHPTSFKAARYTYLSIEALSETNNEPADPALSPEAQAELGYERNRLATALQTAIEKLSPTLREPILLLIAVDDQREAAAQLGISHGALRERLRRARQELRGLLSSLLENSLSESDLGR